ncbi:MAG: hypothetical protein RI947_670 [Candidatus Parcubacteria bacterium]
MFTMILWITVPVIKLYTPVDAENYTTTLTPIYLPDIVVDAYPNISVKPSEKKYFTAMLKEYADQLSNDYTQLFFADKRAAEIQKWGDELTILKPLNHGDIRTNQLIEWWSKKKIMGWGNNEIYGSWESELARFAIHVTKHKKSITNTTEKASLASTLLRDREGIHSIINTLNKPVEDQLYLRKLTNEIFNTLMSGLQIPQEIFNPYHINFSTEHFAETKEYGTYDIGVDIPSSLPAFSQMKLRTNTQLFTPSYRLDTDYGGKSTYIYKHIPITAKTKGFSLDIPENLTYALDGWTKVSTTHTVYPFAYRTKLSDPHTDISYLLTFADTIAVKSLVVIQLDYTDLYDRKQKSAMIFQKETPFHNIAHYIKFGSPIHHIEKGAFTFTILTTHPLSTADLKNYQFRIIPLVAPQANLSKDSPTSAQTITINRPLPFVPIIQQVATRALTTRQTQRLVKQMPWYWRVIGTDGQVVTLVYIPFIASAGAFIITLLLSILHLRFLIKKSTTLVTMAYELSVNLRHRLTKFIRHGRKLWILLLICALLIDLVLAGQQLDVILLAVSLLWLATVVAHSFPPNVNFYISLILIAPYSFFMTFSLKDLAEKTAVYIYLFFVIGLLQSATLLLRKSHLSEELDKIEEDSILFIHRVSAFIYKASTRGVEIYISILQRYFNMKPQTRRDYYMNILKALLLVVFIISGIIGSMYTVKAIKKELKRQERARQNPVILIVGPTVVYRSTKVMIKGKNLGWNVNGNVRLINNGQEIFTDLWTDSKIIFTVPLHWKLGENTLTIEKKIFWEDKEESANSKPVTIKLINAGTSFTSDDDAYFEQLKHLDPEILKLNGYTPEEK